MRKTLTVTATHIKCVDPQDPRRDEIYFISGTEDTSHTTDTKRRIKKGFDEDVSIKLLETRIDDETITPVEVTVWEQRALRDNSKVAKALEDISKKAGAFARKQGGGILWSTILLQVTGLLLENAGKLFKHVFRDSPLGTKEIVIPRVARPDENLDYPESIDGDHRFTFTVKGSDESYYHYEIEILATVA